MRKIRIGILLAAVLLSACRQNGAPPTDSGTPAAVPANYAGRTNPLGADAAAAGSQVFEANCAPCHGLQGHGDGPVAQSLDPRPRNLAELQLLVGDDYLFWRIHDGKPRTSMVAWKGILTVEQIWQTVSFIRTLK